MPLLIPPSTNYPSPLTAVPSLMQDEPKEGRKQVSVEILWATMGGVNKSVYINLQNNATLNITQISTLKIDNSQSGADVTFIFPDTSETVVIPAGTPLAVVPVFSNATQVYISAPAALATDVTRFQMLNYATNPGNVPQTAASQTASAGATALAAGNGTIQLIPVGTSGTLEALQFKLTIPAPPATLTTLDLLIRDPGPPIRTLVSAWRVSLPAGQASILTPVFDFIDLNWRFTNGLEIQWAVTGVGTGYANTFASYHTP